MQRTPRSRLILMALSLVLVFAGIFLFSRQENQTSSGRQGRDLETAARAFRKVRKQVKSAISSPEDPQGRFNFEYRRLRDPRTGRIPANIREKELIFSATIPLAEALFSSADPLARKQVLDWQHRGPYNIGGRTRAMALDVNNENIIVAGGASGGMWRSLNGGQTWVKTTDPTLLQSVTTLTQDKRPGKTNTWYYGTGELVGNSASTSRALYRGNGIFKSVNNGASWGPLPATVSNPSQLTELASVFQWVWRVATNPANAGQDEVLAATIGGIQRSVDGGGTWTTVLGTGETAAVSSHSRFTDIAISPRGVMYATLSQASNSPDGSGSALVRGLFRSVNGQDWVNITPAGWPQGYERVVLSIAPSNDQVVYFLANTPGAGRFDTSLWKYTYLSGTGQGQGGRWENRSANIPGFGGATGDYNHQGNYNMMVAVSPANSEQVFIGGTNLYRSDDGFATATRSKWIGGYALDNTAAMYPGQHPDQHALVFYPGNANKALSAHDGGLSLSSNLMASDTVRWTSLNRGYLTTQFTAVAIDPDVSQDEFILGGMQDNGSWATESQQATATWFSLLTGDGSFGAAVGNSLFVSAQNGFIIRYAFDRQGKFQGYARVDPKGGGGYLFVNPYVVDPNNQYVMYLPAGDTLWRNNNLDAIKVGQNDAFTEPQNTNWKVVNTLSGAQSGQEISAIAVSKSPANLVYLGTATGQLYKLTNTLSSDSPNRSTITGAAFPRNGYISSIAVDPANGNRVVVAFSNYGVISLFHSADGGTSWSAIAGNLEQNPDGSGNGPAVKWVNILPAKDKMPAKYFAGTSTGLYATSTLEGGATTWIKEGSTTIGNIPVDMVVSRSTDNLVAVGTHGNGVYSHFYNEPLAVAPEQQPSTFEVLQNYPNPVRTSTTFTYSLAKAGQVSLRIFDLSGREVARLVEGRQRAGTHQVVWQGQGSGGGRLAQGLYLYQVQVDKQKRTRQLLLLR